MRLIEEMGACGVCFYLLKCFFSSFLCESFMGWKIDHSGFQFYAANRGIGCLLRLFFTRLNTFSINSSLKA